MTRGPGQLGERRLGIAVIWFLPAGESGHGSSTNELLLEDDAGHASPVAGPALGELFRVLRDNVRSVGMNLPDERRMVEREARQRCSSE
jgi:hypothetical protein